MPISTKVIAQKRQTDEQNQQQQQQQNIEIGAF